MQNPRLAARYAKSLLDLSVEKNSLEATLKDMQLLSRVCSSSHDFVVMLRSPVVNSHKKLSIISEVFKNQALDKLTVSFISLLVNKGREMYLPDIAEAFISQYKDMKNIRTVRLTAAAPINDATQKSIVAKVSGYLPGNTIELATAVDEHLIGGFVLEVEDKLYDASVKKSLNDLRAKVIDGSYESKM